MACCWLLDPQGHTFPGDRIGKGFTGWMRELPCSPGVIKDQLLFQNNHWTSQAFIGFWWFHQWSPSRLDRQTSMVKHLLLHHFDFYCACSYLPLLPTPQLDYLIPGGEREGCSFSAGQGCDPLECVWSKQAHAPQLIMLSNVWFPLLPTLISSYLR